MSQDQPDTAPQHAEARFALMFGDRALLARPAHYHLMLLGAESGLDLHLPWESMLAASPFISHHEDGFSWSAQSSTPATVHASLLECLLRECTRVHSNASPSFAQVPKPLAAKAALRTSTFLAYALTEPGLGGETSIRAVLEQAPKLFTGCSVALIPGRLSTALRGALHGAQLSQREEAIEAALEALEINAYSQKTLTTTPRSARL